VIYTKNQAGESWSKPTPTGNENYLNHYIYNWGWSYKGNTMGLPLITARKDAKHDLPFHEIENFVNNRLWGINLGLEGSLNGLSTTIRTTYSRNFGTRITEKQFGKLNQFSGAVGLSKEIKNTNKFFILTTFDIGELLPNSFGISLGLQRSLFNKF
jgi:hypothetical protein